MILWKHRANTDVAVRWLVASQKTNGNISVTVQWYNIVSRVPWYMGITEVVEVRIKDLKNWRMYETKRDE
jgi:hypothetical protein